MVLNDGDARQSAEAPGGMSFKRVRGVRLYESVVNQIFDLIAQGQLAPGHRWPPERSVAQQLGVSRNSGATIARRGRRSRCASTTGIADAVIARAPERARALMQQHFQHTRRIMGLA